MKRVEIFIDFFDVLLYFAQVTKSKFLKIELSLMDNYLPIPRSILVSFFRFFSGVMCCQRLKLKTHKPVDEDGDMKARPVESNTNALPPQKGKSVKNGSEFANEVHGLKINRNEEMGSYDVDSLYPSIPIVYTLELLFAWLILSSIVYEKAVAYTKMARVCMRQNVFKFKEKFYWQVDGTSIEFYGGIIYVSLRNQY